MRRTSGRPSTATPSGWADVQVDLRGLEETLESEAGFLAPVGGLRRVGSGFYSHVLETGSGWIVRVARTPEAGDRHRYECRVLPYLAPQLHVAVPEPVIALRSSDLVPYGAIAYRSLPGREMRAEEAAEGEWPALARQLGHEVARLHDAKLPYELELHRFEPGDFAAVCRQVSEPLRARLTPGEWQKVEMWWERFLGDRSLHDWEPVLTHGDIWWGNLLVDDGRISGIVDWEFLSVGDAAWDLGTMRQFGDAFYGELVEEYLRLRELDPNWAHRAEQWWALRVFFGLQFAIDREDEEEWGDSLRKLREGPILG